MSLDDTDKTLRRLARAPRRVKMPKGDAPATVDIATYVNSILRGVRELTRQPGRKDLALLDCLLATAEVEASTLAARTYH